MPPHEVLPPSMPQPHPWYQDSSGQLGASGLRWGCGHAQRPPWSSGPSTCSSGGPLTSPYSPPAPGPDALGTSLCFPHSQQVPWTALLAGRCCPRSQATQLPHLPQRCPHCRLRDSVRLAWSLTGSRTRSHHHQHPGVVTLLLVP